MLKNTFREKLIYLVNLWRKRPISNYYNKAYHRKVLISYITHPFRKQSFSHTNYYEAIALAKSMDDLGYIVDIVEYTTSSISNINDYDVILGFGDIFQFYFENSTKDIKTIYYGTGMHVCHQNTATLGRLKDVYNKKGKWITKSVRYVDNAWSYQTTLVDGIIALGNEECASTYRKHYTGVVHSIPVPCYTTQNAIEIFKKREPDANRNYLWFGSLGLIHKGLDLLLDYFSKNSHLNLHICGDIFHEKEFIELYSKELLESKNIYVHGFVDITTNKFENILKKCSFSIFPSCSEGGCPSLVTTIINGALIPIATKETSINLENGIIINGFSYNEIDKVIKKTMDLSNEDIITMQRNNLEYFKINNSHSNYLMNLKKSLELILND
ncbi:glycosyltransferase [Psychrobacter sp. AOP22-C1-C5]|uniref:glycosyltransferase n=1 Tax=Psychrobacter sp. AOP22-C1-C5 TaxID=3457716 RepID=UPI0040365256